MTVKLFASVFALAISCAVPEIALAQTNLTGDWDVTFTTPQGPNTVKATFTQAGEKLTGKMTSPMGSVNVDGTVIGTDVRISFSIPIQGNNLTIAMNGKADGDSLSGTASFAGIGESPWTAKRTVGDTPAPSTDPKPPPDAATTAAPLDATGKWDIVLKLPMGEFPLTANLTRDGDKLSGTLTGPQGDVPVTGTIDGSSLKLSFAVKTPNGELPVTMTGELGADGIKGKAEMIGIGQAEWTGKRSAER